MDRGETIDMKSIENDYSNVYLVLYCFNCSMNCPFLTNFNKFKCKTLTLFNSHKMPISVIHSRICYVQIDSGMYGSHTQGHSVGPLVHCYVDSNFHWL